MVSQGIIDFLFFLITENPETYILYHLKILCY